MLKRQYRRDGLRASGERMGDQILWTLQRGDNNSNNKLRQEGKGDERGRERESGKNRANSCRKNISGTHYDTKVTPEV